MDLTINQPKHLGVTPPIVTAHPTQREIEVTDLLLQELTAQGTFESDDESKRREVVLGKLDGLVKEFVYQISKDKENLPEPDAKEAGGKIFTFGSYRLGVHGAGTDIDTLCVVPRHVSREDFFTVMYDFLKKRNEIDLVFARLNLSRVPDDLELRENSLLENLDETCVRSINGSRVTDEILRLVPSIPAFRKSLRCIKLWAKRRAIYSNVMGFLGGVAWAMLVARICQLYPNAIAGAIVSRFFRIMYQWNWPQPVLLKPIEDGPVRVWNPKLYHGDRFHLMPIITPAYPSMCATHNVTQSTKKIIEDEFSRVMIGTGKWSDLFAKHDFFQKYRYYLQIIASSDNAERQLKWSGMVESRIRHLISKLETVENLNLAHPFVKGFDKVYGSEQEANDILESKKAYYCTSEQDLESKTNNNEGPQNREIISNEGPQNREIISNEGSQNGTGRGRNESPPNGTGRERTINEGPKNGTPRERITNESSQNGADTNNPRAIHVTTFYIGLQINPREAGSTSPRQLNISWPTQEFTKLVKSWDKYDENHMKITIKHVKSAELPSEVFEEGEEPRKLKRSKPGGKTESNTTTSEQPSKKPRSSSGSNDTVIDSTHPTGINADKTDINTRLGDNESLQDSTTAYVVFDRLAPKLLSLQNRLEKVLRYAEKSSLYR
ncbi:5828_t:CDS:10, partial [Diversispora eburnea]